MPDWPDRILRPHPDRLAEDHPQRAAILATHAAAVEDDVDGYIDPATGYWVFTARYLDERGHCCEQGCRHCPYLSRD